MNREVTPEMIHNAAAAGQLIPVEDWLVVGMEVAETNVVLVRFNEGPYYSLSIHDAHGLYTTVRNALETALIAALVRDPDEEEAHVPRPTREEGDSVADQG